MEPTDAINQRFAGYVALLAEIDDWCGTRVPGRFPRRPHGVRDVLISVALHNLASQVSDLGAREKIQAIAVQLHVAAGKAIAASSQDPIPPVR